MRARFFPSLPLLAALLLLPVAGPLAAPQGVQQAQAAPAPAPKPGAATVKPPAPPQTQPAAQPVPPQRKGSGLKVPRFATMRAEEVNVRTGPGLRYPVDWVFHKKGMPVEVVAEFDSWRRIRDWQGAIGWVHQSMLVGKRSLIVTAANTAILGEPRADAEMVARLEPGVIGEILACKEPGFCRIRIEGYRGYLPRSAFWGVYPEEKLE